MNAAVATTDRAYRFRPGDVLQRQYGAGWANYGHVTTKTFASCWKGVTTGIYCGINGQWRIVRNGKQVAP